MSAQNHAHNKKDTATYKSESLPELLHNQPSNPTSIPQERKNDYDTEVFPETLPKQPRKCHNTLDFCRGFNNFSQPFPRTRSQVRRKQVSLSDCGIGPETLLNLSFCAQQAQANCFELRGHLLLFENLVKLLLIGRREFRGQLRDLPQELSAIALRCHPGRRVNGKTVERLLGRDCHVERVNGPHRRRNVCGSSQAHCRGVCTQRGAATEPREATHTVEHVQGQRDSHCKVTTSPRAEEATSSHGPPRCTLQFARMAQ